MEIEREMLEAMRDALGSALDELDQYKRLILDVDDTALRSGARWGLCDAIDNDGHAYQSAWAAKHLRRIRSEVDVRAAAASTSEGA